MVFAARHAWVERGRFNLQAALNGGANNGDLIFNDNGAFGGSNLNYDGTDTSVSTGVFKVPPGTAAAPGLAGTTAVDTGLRPVPNDLRLTSGGLDVVRVLNTSRVAIGASLPSPDGTLHVHAGTAGTVTANGSADDLVVENSANAGISILCPDLSTCQLYLGTPSDSVAGVVQWDHTNLDLNIGTSIASGEVILRIGSFGEALRLSATDGIVPSYDILPADNTRKLGDTGNRFTEGHVREITAEGIHASGSQLRVGSDDTGFNLIQNSNQILVNFNAVSNAFWTSGRYMFGTGSTLADGTMHVHTGTAGTVTADGSADDLVVENSANAGISILCPDLSTCQLYLGTPSDSVAGVVQWDHTNLDLNIGTSIASGEVILRIGSFGEALRLSATDGIVPSYDILPADNTRKLGETSNRFTEAHVREITAEGIHASGSSLRVGSDDTGFNLIQNSNQIIVNFNAVPNAFWTASSYMFGTGGTAADGTLHVHTATAGVATASSSADDLVIENSAAGGLTILVPDASDANIILGSPSTATGALIQWNYDGDLFELGPAKTGAETVLRSGNYTEALRLTSDQKVGIGTTTVPHGSTGYAKLAIDGTNGNAAGPHVQWTTASDDFPLLQILPWTHDNISFQLDAYFDGQWRSAGAGSNYQIIKVSDALQFRYDSGIVAGSVVTWNVGFALTTTGRVGINTITPDGPLHVHPATAGVVTARSDADDLVVENNTNMGITLLAPDASYSGIHFGGPASNLRAYARFTGSTSQLTWGTNEANGRLAFMSATNQQRMFIASDGDIAIGTAFSAPLAKVHIRSGDSSAGTPSSNADELVLENNGAAGMTIQTPDANFSQIGFGTPSAQTGALFRWTYNSDQLWLTTNITDGDVKISSGVANGQTGQIDIESLTINIGDGGSGHNQITLGGGQGATTVTIEADTDNVTETDVATLNFSQDGGAVTGFCRLTSGNHFEVGAGFSTADLYFYAGGSLRARITDTGEMGINATPSEKLDILQSNTAFALAVLGMEQRDVDEPFIHFHGTAAAATLTNSIVDNGDVTTATLAGWVKVQVTDDGNQITDQDYYQPLYTLA